MSIDTIDTKALRERIDTTRKTKAGTPLRAALIQELGLDFIEHGPALLDAADRLAALEAENGRLKRAAGSLRSEADIARIAELEAWRRRFDARPTPAAQESGDA